MNRIYVPRKESKHWNVQTVIFGTVTFLFGCLLTASVVLNVKVNSVDPHQQHRLHPPPLLEQKAVASSSTSAVSAGRNPLSSHDAIKGVKILVNLVAFDFSQIPHLEEVLDSYHDVCTAGAGRVDVMIHSTVAYPVVILDLWNTRFTCENFEITIVLKPKNLRLHLVDCHREVFYQNIDKYDLFIYSEDDIRVRPTTIATYLVETEKVRRAVAESPDHTFSDFNVGIVRYEYNYPANVIMDDNTRHATQNVTRAYWEHSGFQRPVVPNAVTAVEQAPLAKEYITMKNHHQGMYLATRDLLKAWKERCDFHIAKNRPGRGGQPSEGTQRVW
jgi:hypothetical protein